MKATPPLSEQGEIMTDKQPKALRLAELLDFHRFPTADEAATELCRLHEVNQELLEALNVLLDNNEMLAGTSIALAAIAKATGKQP